MLILQRKAGESLVIGEDITIRVVSVDGTRVRLAISAPDDVPILRTELVTANAANRDSSMEESAPAEVLERCEPYLNLPADTLALYTDLWVDLGIS